MIECVDWLEKDLMRNWCTGKKMSKWITKVSQRIRKKDKPNQKLSIQCKSHDKPCEW